MMMVVVMASFKPMKVDERKHVIHLKLGLVLQKHINLGSLMLVRL